MSIILKFDSKKKRSATIKNLYRYIVSGETKQNPTGNPDSVLATGNEKLIHIYSSHHIEPFLYSKKDDEAYIKNYIEEATTSFNDAVEMRLTRSNRENTYSHLIVAPSEDEFGKHTPEELTEMAKEAFCRVYGMDQEDFIGTIALHETEKNGVKKNDLHVAGCLINKEGKTPKLYKGFMKHIEKVSRQLEKDFGFSVLKSSLVKDISFAEKAYYETTQTHKPKASVKSALKEVLQGSTSFSQIVTDLNDNDIYLKLNTTSEGKVSGATFLHEPTNTQVKLSDVKQNYYAGEKLTTDSFFKDHCFFDYENIVQRELIADQISHFEDSVDSCSITSKRLKKVADKSSEIFPNDYFWLDSIFQVVLNEMGENAFNLGNWKPITENGDQINFTTNTDFVLKSALLRSIEKFNYGTEEKYDVALKIKGGPITKRKLYIELEKIKAENPDKFENVSFTNYFPSRSEKKRGQRAGEEVRILKELRQELSFMRRQANERVLDLSKYENPYKAYSILAKERIEHPEKFIQLEIVGHKPTMKQRMAEDAYKKEHEINLKNRFFNDYKQQYVEKYGEETYQRNATQYRLRANAYVDKKLKEHKLELVRRLDQAHKDIVVDVNGNPNLYDNSKLNKEYAEYLAVKEANNDSKIMSAEEFKEVMEKMKQENQKIYEDMQNKKKRKEGFNL